VKNEEDERRKQRRGRWVILEGRYYRGSLKWEEKKKEEQSRLKSDASTVETRRKQIEVSVPFLPR